MTLVRKDALRYGQKDYDGVKYDGHLEHVMILLLSLGRLKRASDSFNDNFRVSRQFCLVNASVYRPCINLLRTSVYIT